MTDLAEIKVITDGGPWAQHNFPCPVCRIQKAVLDLNTNIFHPCWGCQSKGWELKQKRVWPWSKRK